MSQGKMSTDQTTTAPDSVLIAMEDDPDLPDCVATAWEAEAEAEAMGAAVTAWESQTSMDYSTDGLTAACWAFHERMLKEQP